MLSDSSKTDRKILAAAEDLGDEDLGDEAVENFVFEATPGLRLDPGDAGGTPSPKIKGTAKQRTRVQSGPADDLLSVQPSMPRRPRSTLSFTPNSTTKKKRRGGIPPWSLSLALHLSAVLLLGSSTLTTLREAEEIGPYAISVAIDEEVEDFQEIDINTSEELDALDMELNADWIDPGEDASGELAVESDLSDLVGESALASDHVGDLGTLFGDTGRGMSDLGKGEGAATASFFGTKVQAGRVLYMLDNSGSMNDGRLETMIGELIRSVNRLKPRQRFYVIFYSDTVYPLFFPNSAQQFVRANDRNKRQLVQWLQTVELCGGNAVDEAIEAAMLIRPDVLFMLSDGHVRTTPSGRKYNLLLDSAGRDFVIHTLGMGCKKEVHREQLTAIAKAHGGTFHEIEIDPQAAAEAKENPRPYRTKKNPGPIWGR